MIDATAVLNALGVLEQQLMERSLDEQVDEMAVLVLQRQQLLEAYLQTLPPQARGQTAGLEFVRRMQRVNNALIDKVRAAHEQAADELDALTRGKTALSAYQDQASSVG